MKTILWTGPGEMEMRTAPRPVPGPGEVLMRVAAVGICGSELEGYLGHSSIRQPPLVMGHEFCGTLVDATSGQGNAEQLVAVNPLLSCGDCPRCRTGEEYLCRRRTLIGAHRPGAFAGYVSVPERSLIALPRDLSPALGALVEPLAVALHALRLGGAAPDQHVAVWGAGSIGTLVALGARSLGITRISLVDTNPGRLQVITNLRLGTAINPRLEDTTAILAAATGGEGIDLAIDTVGSHITRSAAVACTRNGGTITLVGLRDQDTSFDVNKIVRSEQRLLGSYTYSPADLAYAVTLLSTGQIPQDTWLECRSLDAGPAAFAGLVAGSITTSKIVLVPAASDYDDMSS